ncbi:sortase B protein-sorting domain-containing protein [Ammoniphilus sp. 3BR4]|uniref:sortase B protein-sorting domain-containing protein n=1 Tax=Ammoniphilus sp. 3BR4 TaxID=3158265 RepID=UPI0034656860
MNKWSPLDMAQIGLLAALIAVSGSFKIPSGIPGSDFQLSSAMYKLLQRVKTAAGGQAYARKSSL